MGAILAHPVGWFQPLPNQWFRRPLPTVERVPLDDLEPFDLHFETGRLQGGLQQLRERITEIARRFFD
jgi:hypothetical protein